MADTPATAAVTTAATTAADVNSRALAVKAQVGTSSMSAMGLSGALAIVLIYHFNQLLTHYGMTPLPAEVAGQYQILFSGLGIYLFHRMGVSS